jgi:hypothetical protein
MRHPMQDEQTEEQVRTLVTVASADVPNELRVLLASFTATTVLASLELLPDGRLVVQVVPDVDAQVVARLRRTLAQYDDVLRRLT